MLKAKLVPHDYINIEVADVIKAYLINPLNALNTNQPTFAYNELTNPVITGQVYFGRYSRCYFNSRDRANS
jgi:hypothetical protein